jgi:hypothetical protein
MSMAGFFTAYECGYATAYNPGSLSSVLPPNVFEVDLFAYLSAVVPGVAIYPGHIPQGAGSGPAISYFAVSEEPFYTLARAAGLTARVYQFSTWSPSYLSSVSIERSLRSVLHGYRGQMGSTFVSSCRLQQCLDLPYEPNVDGSDVGTYQRAVEYRIAFKEPIPILY